jgi:hypothetical protein
VIGPVFCTKAKASFRQFGSQGNRGRRRTMQSESLSFSRDFHRRLNHRDEFLDEFKHVFNS